MCAGRRDHSLGRVRFEASRRRPMEVGRTVPVESGQGLYLFLLVTYKPRPSRDLGPESEPCRGVLKASFWKGMTEKGHGSQEA